MNVNLIIPYIFSTLLLIISILSLVITSMLINDDKTDPKKTIDLTEAFKYLIPFNYIIGFISLFFLVILSRENDRQIAILIMLILSSIFNIITLYLIMSIAINFILQPSIPTPSTSTSNLVSTVAPTVPPTESFTQYFL